MKAVQIRWRPVRTFLGNTTVAHAFVGRKSNGLCMCFRMPGGKRYTYEDSHNEIGRPRCKLCVRRLEKVK
jgi:hypothetical protein